MWHPVKLAIRKCSRRRFIGESLGISAAGWLAAGCETDKDMATNGNKLAWRESPESPTESSMRLALSVRVAEAFHSKEESTMTLDELIALARRYGYSALCMRASQVGTQSASDTVREAGQKIGDAGLTVSMVTGDFNTVYNNDQGPKALRNITPYLDLAEALHSNLIRVCMKKEEDIGWAGRAADEARERRIRLAHQSHCSSLFETVSGSLEVLRKVHRPNFGIIYEPANWMIVGEDYGKETIRQLSPYLFNVYVQNHSLNPDGESYVMTWKEGRVPLDHIGLWDVGGVDFEEMFEGLHAVGYGGYVTVHQAFGGIMPVEVAVQKSAEYLKGLL